MEELFQKCELDDTISAPAGTSEGSDGNDQNQPSQLPLTILSAQWLDSNNTATDTSETGQIVRIRLTVDRDADPGTEIVVGITEYNVSSGGIEIPPVSVPIDGRTGISADIEVAEEWDLKQLVVSVTAADNAGIIDNDLPDNERPRLGIMCRITRIPVEVRDCRSGAVIANAKVKNLKIVDGDLSQAGTVLVEKTGGEGFDRSWTALPELATVQNSIKALNRLLGLNQNEGSLPAAYNDTWKGHYRTYWQRRLPGRTITVPDDGPPLHVLQLIINEYNSHRATDAQGILTIHVPTNLLDGRRVRLDIGFWDFPVAMERTGGPVRPAPQVDENGQPRSLLYFNVKWGMNAANAQSTDWNGGFNWFLETPGTTVDTSTNTPAGGGQPNHNELKVSERLVIKSDTGPFSQLDEGLFSPNHTDTARFTLFGMQWCQPVYDGIEDVVPENGVRSNQHSFVNQRDANNNWIRGLNMHIITRYNYGEYNPYGHYYGFYENVNSSHRKRTKQEKNPSTGAVTTIIDTTYRHGGIDFYGGSSEGTTPIFAIHGGKATRSGTQGGSAGYYAELLFVRETGGPKVRYLHLHNQALFNNQHVMAGIIMGYCGRRGAGFENTDSPFHMHFELRSYNANSDPGITGTTRYLSEISNQDILHPDNRASFDLPTGPNSALFLGNNAYPLMLPCACTYNETYANPNPRNCQYSDISIINQCWCVKEFPCHQCLISYASHNTINHQPSDMPVPTGQVTRFVCPHILTSNPTDIAIKRRQLQAKLRFIFENSGLLNIPNDNRFTSYRYNGETNNGGNPTNGIDGSIGDSTRNWIKAIIEVYQDNVLEEGDPDKTIEVTHGNSTEMGHTRLFVHRYENNALANNTLVDAAFDWFNNFFNEL